MSTAPRARVVRLIEAARRIADPNDALGRRARELLPKSTGLSPEGVDLALARCLEVDPSDDELDQLCAGVTEAPHAHVLLSSNVFVAAHRAIAIGLAQSARVSVRASRREPELARLLHEGSNGAFRLVDELTPSPGDHVWAYGNDETLAKLRGELPAGVVYHPHGHGFGIAIVETVGEHTAAGLADDTALFDQRGCLSPRVALFVGEAEPARDFAQALARELARVGHDVPRGEIDADEASDIVRYRDTMLYAAELLHAGKGYVGLDVAGEHLLVPPVGRNLHIVRTADPESALRALGTQIAAIGISASPALTARVRELLPGARISDIGQMQRPPFDGPVDLRTPSKGEIL